MMSTEKYYDIIEKLDDCLYYYESRDFDYTKFFLEFANGEKITIKFDPKNIPHLLGINIDYLRSTGLYNKNDNAYQILDEIVRNPKKLLSQIEDGHIPPQYVFSDYIEEKLDNFKNVCGINISNIEFIVKYEKSKNFSSEKPLYDGYYIGYMNNNQLSVIGFEKNENNNAYYPHTNLLFEQYSPETDEFLKRLCANQTLTMIEIMRRSKLTEDGNINKTTHYYYNHDKLAKLRSCKRYAEMYNGVPNTIVTSIFFVEKVTNLNEEKRNTTSMLEEIAKKIEKRKIIDMHNFTANYDSTPDGILDVVSAHNDSLVNSKTNNNSEEEYSYRDIIEQYEECKKEIERLNHLLEKADEKTRQLVGKNETLEKENKGYEEKIEQIKGILK
ncbi:MAG: hypothetical protein IJL74_03800 [Bacilli bacterium]|nr:hypothetical protein [Bacilli bacterium]